jgi:hypothetical protein
MSDEPTMVYFCCDERRRSAVRLHPTLNGIDFIEVVDREATDRAERQRVLRLHLLKKLELPAGRSLTADNIEIDGGVRIIDPRPDSVPQVDEDLITVHVDSPGDFSTYTLRLIEENGNPLAGFDPLLSAVDFSFKIECASDFDCRQEQPCPTEPLEEPEIDYMAKDFNSLRQLMLDRLSVIIPQWKERNPADLGITLVELFAYIGDQLAYRQDAVATEAYLGTARLRTSVRRHARLVDYVMSDGCNARLPVQARTDANDLLLKKGTQLMTAVAGFQPRIAAASTELDRLLASAPEVFETMHDQKLFAAHNRMSLHTWGERECCLPKGAMRAALAGRYADLRKGDLLVFQEERGARTGNAADADRTRRHAVRLKRDPVLTEDPLYTDPDDPARQQQVTLIEWTADDALPFPFCISAVTDGQEEIGDVSVALGNIVLADHGRTIIDEPIGTPGLPAPSLAQQEECGHCGDHQRKLLHPRFRPRLTRGPLTMGGRVSKSGVIEGRRRALAFDPDDSAASAFNREMNRVSPEITIIDENGDTWFPQRDLLASDEFASEFVAEVEDDGRASLRFGDDEYGRRPTPGVAMHATYRVGNGTRGNVGAGALGHIVSDDDGITAVYNPLPARGGSEPESIEHVRQNAPSAFFRQERAVTAEDYAEVTGRHRQVQRAAATMRWTGSWRTVFVTVDPLGGGSVDEELESRLREHIERYRMAGHDIEIDGPRYVPIELELTVCVEPDYFRSDVRKAILEVLSNRAFPDGGRGFFHPDSFTFGQPLYLSRIYAAVQSVAGVSSVEITTFGRSGSRSRESLTSGVLAIGRLEIARLDNDRNFPENGVIRLTMGGGR